MGPPRIVRLVMMLGFVLLLLMTAPPEAGSGGANAKEVRRTSGAVPPGATMLLAQQPASSSTTSPSLDFEFFKARVQPLFLARRPGYARCVACHTPGRGMGGGRMVLQPLPPGRSTWNDEESRKNFESVSRLAQVEVPEVPGIIKSRLLVHPLVTEAGGTLFHNGGKPWKSQDDPEWQTLAAWVGGEAVGK